MILIETIQCKLKLFGSFLLLQLGMSCYAQHEAEPIIDLLAKEVFADLSKGEQDIFQKKFKVADTYLRAKLNAIPLSDTTQFHIKYMMKLKTIPRSGNDSNIQSNRLKYLLLASITQPYSCDSLFYELLIDTKVQNINAETLQRSLFTYKFWLYNLLNYRYLSETTHFQNKITRERNSYLFLLLKQDFKSLDDERRLLDLSKSLISSEMEYFDYDTILSTKMAKVYFRRYLVVATAYESKRRTALKNLMIEIANYAIKLDPNNAEYHYELSEFYSNEAMIILSQLDYGSMSLNQIRNLQTLANRNVSKSEYHMKIANQLSTP